VADPVFDLVIFYKMDVKRATAHNFGLEITYLKIDLNMSFSEEM